MGHAPCWNGISLANQLFVTRKGLIPWLSVVAILGDLECFGGQPPSLRMANLNPQRLKREIEVRLNWPTAIPEYLEEVELS